MPEKPADNLISRICDYLFALRPMLIIPVWTILLLGAAGDPSIDISRIALTLVMISATCLSGAVFILNQIHDIESDRLNDKIFFLTRGIITLRAARTMYLVLSLAGIAAAGFISLPIVFVALAILLLGYFYSSPPVALKNRPWSALLASSIGHGTLVYILGYCAGGGDIIPGLLKSLPYLLAVASVYIGTTLPDIEGDRGVGKITLGVKLGIPKAAMLMAGIYFAGLGNGYIVGDILFLIAAGSVAPFFIWLAISRSAKSAVFALRISILALSLAAGYNFPAYLIFLIALILATRLYYKKRFRIKYPSLT